MMYYRNMGLMGTLGNTPTTPTTPSVTMEEIKRRREILEALAKEHRKTSPWVYGIIAFGLGVLIMRR